MPVRSHSLMLPTVAIICLALIRGCGCADVWLQFYLNKVALWEQEGQLSKFQAAIVEGLTAYCANAANSGSCGLGGSAGSPVFNASVVNITTGYPTKNGSWYMDLRFSISYSTGGSVYTMPTAAVAEITANQRQTIKDRIGYYIVYIGNQVYTVPPPTLVNQVVVPITVLATALLVAVAMGLRHRHRDEEMTYLIRARRAESDRSRRSSKTADATADDVQPASPTSRPTKKANGGGVGGGGEGSGASFNTGLQNPGFDKSQGEFELRHAAVAASTGETQQEAAEQEKRAKKPKKKKKKTEQQRRRHDSDERPRDDKEDKGDEREAALMTEREMGDGFDFALDFGGVGGAGGKAAAATTAAEASLGAGLGDNKSQRSPTVEI